MKVFNLLAGLTLVAGLAPSAQAVETEFGSVVPVRITLPFDMETCFKNKEVYGNGMGISCTFPLPEYRNDDVRVSAPDYELVDGDQGTVERIVVTQGGGNYPVSQFYVFSKRGATEDALRKVVANSGLKEIEIVVLRVKK